MGERGGFITGPTNTTKLTCIAHVPSFLGNRVDDLQKPIDNPENINWESYARGAVYALQNSGYDLRKVTPLHLSLKQSRIP